MTLLPTFQAAATAAAPGMTETNRELAVTLQAVTDHLSGAALAGAEMAQRLAGMAQAQLARLEAIADEAAFAADREGTQGQGVAPATMVDAIKRIQLLTAASNNAAELGMNLLKANKELTQADGAPTPVTIAFTVKDARRDADDNIFAEPAASPVSAAAA